MGRYAFSQSCSSVVIRSRTNYSYSIDLQSLETMTLGNSVFEIAKSIVISSISNNC